MRSFLIGLFLIPVFLQAQAPFTITLSDAGINSAPALQSFCMARLENLILVFGGRVNGFHRTSDKESTFPSQFDNQKFWVIDPLTGKTWNMAIPSAWLLQLRTTNMGYYQDENTLYVCGGYGSTCNNDDPSCYQTFPNLTAINVKGLVTAIMAGQSSLDAYITSITDERFRVTGGTLQKLGAHFYLVFGHNYNSVYKGGVTGVYTEEIRRFDLSIVGKNLQVSNYQPITTQLTYGGFSQFHRRDLNIVPVVTPSQTAGLTAFGGVFTNQAGPYPNPIQISSDGTNTAVNIDTTFRQKTCLYDCAHIMLYDAAGKNMYTTFLGGITDYYYQGDSLVPGNMSNFMPFFNHTSTIRQDAKGRYTEFPQLSPSLPGYIGADAVFFPAPGIGLYKGSSEIIDYNNLPAGKTFIGWMYGGIAATAQQANEFNPTTASNKFYQVYLQKNAAATSSLTSKTTAMPTDISQSSAGTGASAALKAFKDHPLQYYVDNSTLGSIVGYLLLAVIIGLSFWFFFNSALCRDNSYGPDGKLRPFKERPFSYSKVQLFWWTLIVIFGNGWFFAGHGILLPLNPTALILLGGGLAVTIFGQTIDNSQTRDNKEKFDNTTVPVRHQDVNPSQGFLADILSDDNGISIHRLQAVFFNLLYGIGFLQAFFTNLALKKYPFMDLETWQLTLLGISAAGYLGLKTQENNPNTAPARKQEVEKERAKLDLK